MAEAPRYNVEKWDIDVSATGRATKPYWRTVLRHADREQADTWVRVAKAKGIKMRKVRA